MCTCDTFATFRNFHMKQFWLMFNVGWNIKALQLLATQINLYPDQNSCTINAHKCNIWNMHFRQYYDCFGLNGIYKYWENRVLWLSMTFFTLFNFWQFFKFTMIIILEDKPYAVQNSSYVWISSTLTAGSPSKS